MAEIGGGTSSADQDRAQVNARIVYWGIPGSGKRTNLEGIHARLRSDHRGDLREVPTRIDPTVTYTMMPIELGDVGGVRTRIQVVSAPGEPEHAPTRKHLLDEVDGIVFVVDTRRDRIEANLASFEELREALAAYGRQIEDVPLVIQYNKRDQEDPYALEELHRKLSIPGVAAFEAVAQDGTAVLQTLTTVSKRVIRSRRESAASGEATSPPPGVTQLLDQAAAPAPDDAIQPSDLLGDDGLDDTIAEAESLFDPSFAEATDGASAAAASPFSAEVGALGIVSVGAPTVTGPRSVRIPLVVRDEQGAERRLAISVDVSPEADEEQPG